MITDWDKWMNEHHIYIPTQEEIERANQRNEKKVHAIRKNVEACGEQLKAYREKVKEGSNN